MVKKALERAAVDGVPVTLHQAHAVLGRERPDRAAPASEWLAYRQRAAQLYRHISRIDPNHHYEALHFAATEREDAEAVAAEIRSSAAPAQAEIDPPSGGGTR